MWNKLDFKNYILKKGLLIIVSGPSGSGKSTICTSYASNFENTMLSISETTRSPRKREKNGREYYFIDEDTFKKREAEGYYLESASNYKNSYGTPKEPVLKAMDQGFDVLLEIDPQGALKVKEAIPSALMIFFLPGSLKTQKNQIKGRNTETQEEIDLRLSETIKELDYLPKYDYVIVNQSGKRTQTLMTLANIIESERHNVKRILEQYDEDDNNEE